MKFENEEVWQVKTNMFNLENWLRSAKKKDRKCPECGKLYKEIGEDIALMTFHSRQNIHICNSCGEEYIRRGAVDISALQVDNDIKKEQLIKDILSMKKVYKIEDKSLKELEKMFPKIKEEYNKEVLMKRKIEESKPNDEDWELEPYLKEQYDIYQDKEYLYSEYQIEGYFYNEGYDFFDCGQGYYEDEVVILVNIGKRFFDVILSAEIVSSKQDVGDRLYWVDRITSVKYEEVEKPKKKDKLWINYRIELSEENKVLLDKYMKNKGINYK